jgi:hypothetical protein
VTSYLSKHEMHAIAILVVTFARQSKTDVRHFTFGCSLPDGPRRCAEHSYSANECGL